MPCGCSAGPLALAGRAAGLLTGKLVLDALVAWLPRGIPRIAEASIDARVLLVTFAGAALTGLLCGLRPVWQLAGRAPAAPVRTE